MTLGPLPPIANMLRVVISGEIDAENVFPWANVLHFGYTGVAPSNVTCAAIASVISTEWATHMAPECPSPTTLTKVTVTDLTSDSAGEGEDLTVHAGTRGDDSIPANAAGLISYPSEVRYRGGHPRTYLYVGGNADLEGAAKWSTLFTAEFLAHWKDFLNAVIAISESGTNVNSMASIRYYGKFLPNDGPPRFRLVTPVVNPIVPNTAVSQQEIASQRRRVGRRKR